MRNSQEYYVIIIITLLWSSLWSRGSAAGNPAVVLQVTSEWPDCMSAPNETVGTYRVAS